MRVLTLTSSSTAGATIRKKRLRCRAFVAPPGGGAGLEAMQHTSQAAAERACVEFNQGLQAANTLAIEPTEVSGQPGSTRAKGVRVWGGWEGWGQAAGDMYRQNRGPGGSLWEWVCDRLVTKDGVGEGAGTHSTVWRAKNGGSSWFGLAGVGALGAHDSVLG